MSQQSSPNKPAPAPLDDPNSSGRNSRIAPEENKGQGSARQRHPTDAQAANSSRESENSQSKKGGGSFWDLVSRCFGRSNSNEQDKRNPSTPASTGPEPGTPASTSGRTASPRPLELAADGPDDLDDEPERREAGVNSPKGGPGGRRRSREWDAPEGDAPDADAAPSSALIYSVDQIHHTRYRSRGSVARSSASGEPPWAGRGIPIPPMGGWHNWPDAVIGPPSASDNGKVALVLDLDETLVHSSFKPVPNADFVIPVEIDGRVMEVYVLKRPYVDEFMEAVKDDFEVIVFTASLAKYADPLLDLLDPGRTIRFRLFREACHPFEGNYIKNLQCLGRDLARTVIIDNSPHSYIFHPEVSITHGNMGGEET